MSIKVRSTSQSASIPLPVVPSQTRVTQRRRAQTRATAQQHFPTVQEDIAQYQQLQLSLNQLEDSMKPLKERMLRHLQAHAVNELESADGSYSIKLRSRTSWEYSAKLQIREENLKAAKKLEQLKGVAKASVKEYVEGRLSD